MSSLGIYFFFGAMRAKTVTAVVDEEVVWVVIECRAIVVIVVV